MGNYATKEQVATLETQISATNEQVATLETQISDLKSNEISTLQGKVGRNEDQLSEILMQQQSFIRNPYPNMDVRFCDWTNLMEKVENCYEAAVLECSDIVSDACKAEETNCTPDEVRSRRNCQSEKINECTGFDVNQDKGNCFRAWLQLEKNSDMMCSDIGVPVPEGDNTSSSTKCRDFWSFDKIENAIAGMKGGGEEICRGRNDTLREADRKCNESVADCPAGCVFENQHTLAFGEMFEMMDDEIDNEDLTLPSVYFVQK